MTRFFRLTLGVAAIFLAFSLLCIVGGVGCTTVPAPATKPAPRGSKVKLLLFTQQGCAPCILLKSQIYDRSNADIINSFELEEVYPGDPRFEEYGVTSTPALFLLVEGGTAKRYPGGSLGQLRLWLCENAPKQTRAETIIECPLAASLVNPRIILGKISEGGPTSPDGKASVVCDLPASERKKNIPSKGLGCCVFRSIEYAARWQQVPELYDLPEQMVKAGIAGGGWPEKATQVVHKFAPNAQFVQDTSGDPEILEAILKSGRLPCITYSGRDGVHYSGSIAHMVCLPYFDRATNWACVSDNNYIGENQFLWMTCEELVTRWKGQGGGWVFALLAAPPPFPPHN